MRIIDSKDLHVNRTDEPHFLETYVDIDLQELLMKYPDLCLSHSSGTKVHVCIHLQDLHVKETHVPLETYGCVDLEDLHVNKWCISLPVSGKEGYTCICF